MTARPLSKMAPQVTALVLLWTLAGCEDHKQPATPAPGQIQNTPALIEGGPSVQGAAIRYGATGEAVVLLLDTNLLDVDHDKWQAWVNEHESSWVAAAGSRPPWTNWTTQTNAAWVAISSPPIGFGTGVQAAGSAPWDTTQRDQLLKAHGLTQDPSLFSEQLLSPDGRWGVVIVAAAANPDRAPTVPVIGEGSGGERPGPFTVLITGPDVGAPATLVELSDTADAISFPSPLGWSGDSRFYMFVSAGGVDRRNRSDHRQRVWIVPAPTADAGAPDQVRK